MVPLQVCGLEVQGWAEQVGVQVGNTSWFTKVKVKARLGGSKHCSAGRCSSNSLCLGECDRRMDCIWKGRRQLQESTSIVGCK